MNDIPANKSVIRNPVNRQQVLTIGFIAIIGFTFAVIFTAVIGNGSAFALWYGPLVGLVAGLSLLSIIVYRELIARPVIIELCPSGFVAIYRWGSRRFVSYGEIDAIWVWKTSANLRGVEYRDAKIVRFTKRIPVAVSSKIALAIMDGYAKSLGKSPRVVYF